MLVCWKSDGYSYRKNIIRFLKCFHFTQYFSTTAHFIWDLLELRFFMILIELDSVSEKN